jgi:hypothetical protein
MLLSPVVERSGSGQGQGRGATMKAGDMVLLNDDGTLSFEPDDGHADAELQDAGPRDRLLGVIVDVRDPIDDTVVKLPAPAPNVTPPFITLGDLKQNFPK